MYEDRSQNLQGSKIRILVNTISTKKITGGAFQISYNFLLKTLEKTDVDWYYFTSKDLDEVVGEQFKAIKGTKYFVFPTQPDFLGSYRSVKKQVKELECYIQPAVVYSLTAPSYFRFKSTEVMRFTNPWVTHPNRYSWNILPFKDKIRYYIYIYIQKRMMRHAHYFITQTETCAEGIIHVTNEPKSHVKVVNNVLPAVFKNMDNSAINRDEWINIACVGAPTIHKNFDIIPDVLKELNRMDVNNVRFHVTLPFDDKILKKIDSKLYKYNLAGRLINHGKLSQNELGKLYQSCQFCFLPTLLEVFSASILEAMYYHLPIVATDFPFNTEVLRDACLYYQPTNAKSAAEQFYKLFYNISLQKELVDKMSKQLLFYDDYDSHFEKIEDFLKTVALGNL